MLPVKTKSPEEELEQSHTKRTTANSGYNSVHWPETPSNMKEEEESLTQFIVEVTEKHISVADVFI